MYIIVFYAWFMCCAYTVGDCYLIAYSYLFYIIITDISYVDNVDMWISYVCNVDKVKSYIN